MDERGRGVAHAPGLREDSIDVVVPSVKEVMDSVTVGAGLGAAMDGESYFGTDEEQERETSRDVVKAIAAVRPLLQQYRDRYLEVSEHLSRAQSSAAQATRGGRERSQRQLQAFESLRGECAQLGLDLTVSASDTMIGMPEAHGSGNAAGQAEGNNAFVRAAQEATALAARYRSLLQHKGRMRSVLQVLAVSEQAGAALRSETGESRRGKGAEEALKSIEALRSLLCDYFDRPDNSPELSTAGEGAKGAAAVEVAAVAPSSRVAAELEKVTRGRLDWLTQRLRAEFSMEIASALQEADLLGPTGGYWTNNDSIDGGLEGIGGKGEGILGKRGHPGAVDEEKRRLAVARVKAAVKHLFRLQFGGLTRGLRPNAMQLSGVRHGQGVSSRSERSGMVAAAEVAGDATGEEASEQGTRPPARGPAFGGGGAVWALDVLLEPVVMRFRFHFEEERPTNRTDRPEWFFSFLLRVLETYRPLLEDSEVNKSYRGSGSGGGEEVDRLAYFARGLALLARRRLRAQLGAAVADVALLSHTVEEALSFDRQLDREAGYAECATRFPGQTWPRCVGVFAHGEARFKYWMESDAADAEAKLADAVAAPGAWHAVNWENGPSSSTPVTPSAVALCRIFCEITERYRPLRDPLKKLRFARHVQEPLLRSYRNMLYWRGNVCGLDTVFRDDGGESEGTSSTWAAALGAVLGNEKIEDTSPIGRWRSYCLAASSCAYMCAVLRDSEDDLLFAEMAEAAAAAASTAGTNTAGEPAGLGPTSASLVAMGTAVGAAVGGVSQAVTSVATSAETATAGVVRAVGGGTQSTIIGPTHAISAALTTLKGATRAARRVVGHRPYSGSSAGGGDRGGGEASATVAGQSFYTQEGDDSGSGGEGGVGGSIGRNGIAVNVDTFNESGSGVGFAAAGGAEVEEGLAAPNGVENNGAGGAAVEAGGERKEGTVFSEEAERYGLMLDAMVENAVAACRDGFLWCTRSYLRSWDRGLAVVIPAATTGLPAAAAEASGKLATGIELLYTAMGVAEGALPPAQFREWWTGLASNLDSVMLSQIVPRQQEVTQDEGLQLRADLKALMSPFSAHARRRPEKHFAGLTEAALLLSLEKSQLRSLSSGLEAHGGGVNEARRGRGWDGWREEGGKLSPEGTQMRDMLENVGVRRLGPAEASLLLDKRLRGDRKENLLRLSAVAGDVRSPRSSASHGLSEEGAVPREDAGEWEAFPRPERDASGGGGGAGSGGRGGAMVLNSTNHPEIISPVR